MSFNVRNSAARDGENRWDRRKGLLLDTIRAYDPDVLGMQEVLADQADFLREQLRGYGFAGGGRDDGERRGEYSPVMFRTDRFELLASGQWWLSETPERVGSRGWDAALPRVVTWVKLRDRRTGASLLVFNTHWDHVGKTARIESAKLMRRLIEEQRGRENGLPTIVIGDFNTTEDAEPYRTLTGAGGGGLILADAYRQAHPQSRSDEASFHASRGTRDGKRIDWVLCSPEWAVRGAAIDHTQREGRYPSDHYPVTAELELKR